MILCKSGKCFNALFMLLYVCLEDSRQLYDIMREWNPTSGAVNGTFAHFVFEKWMRGGTTRDMQHLLKGPAELDARLVQYLVFEERYDLAAAVQVKTLPREPTSTFSLADTNGQLAWCQADDLQKAAVSGPQKRCVKPLSAVLLRGRHVCLCTSALRMSLLNGCSLGKKHRGGIFS